MSTIKNQMSHFQKKLWSHPRPIDYCIETVEGTLLELQRVQTVMAEALHRIDELWNAHSAHAAKSGTESQLTDLMHCLHGKAHGMYLQHLSPEEREEYNERIKNKTAFPDS